MKKNVYGKNIQLAPQQSFLPHLNSVETDNVQSIKGTFLYYACTVYPTMLPALSKISTYQYVPTQDKPKKYNHMLDYAPMNPNATI